MTNDKLKAYLESIGVSIGDESGSEIHYCCPLHDDNVISASFNADKETWKCFAQCGGGGLLDFIMRAEKKPKSVALAKARLLSGSNPEVPVAEIEEAHQALLADQEVMDFLLSRRGISRKVIEHFKLGLKGNRIWIPQQLDGVYYQVKRWDAMRRCGEEAKFMTYKSGYGKGIDLLWPQESLKQDHVWLCEGEGDVMSALSLGLPSVTLGSVTSNIEDVLDQLIGKPVFIIFDNDDAGRKGSEVAAEMLSRAGVYTKIIDVRKLGCVIDKEDMTDAIMKYKMSQSNFYDLAEVTHVYTSVVAPPPQNDKYEDTTFTNLLAMDVLGKKVTLEVAIIGIEQTPSKLAKTFTALCSARSDAKCHACPLSKMGVGTIDYQQNPERFLQWYFGGMNDAAGIPTFFGMECKKMSIQANTQQSVRRINMAAPVGISDNPNRGAILGVCMGTQAVKNEIGRHVIFGVVTKAPKTNQITLVVDKITDVTVGEGNRDARFIGPESIYESVQPVPTSDGTGVEGSADPIQDKGV